MTKGNLGRKGLRVHYQGKPRAEDHSRIWRVLLTGQLPLDFSDSFVLFCFVESRFLCVTLAVPELTINSSVE